VNTQAQRALAAIVAVLLVLCLPLLLQHNMLYSPAPDSLAPSHTGALTAQEEVQALLANTIPLAPDYFGRRFISHKLGGRFNNHRQSLSISLLLARLLNRTLVVSASAHYASSMDLRSLSLFHPTLIVDSFDAFHKSFAEEERCKLEISADQSVLYLSRSEYELDVSQRAWFENGRQRATFKNHSYFPSFLLEEMGPGTEKGDCPVLIYDQVGPE
jgi:hypothetical protein